MEKFALIQSQELIEIKCSYAVRDIKIEQAIEKQIFCLTKEGDNIKINKAHDIITRCRGNYL